MSTQSQLYYPVKCTPSVFPANQFDPVADSEILKGAMKGFHTNEQEIIDILAQRNIYQRLEIIETYQSLYDKDLVGELKHNLGGRFEDVIVALMTPLSQFYAKELHHAVHGLGTDEKAIIEILCTLSNYGIRTICAEYELLYDTTLESDLAGDTSGRFQRLLVTMCLGNRDEDQTVDCESAKVDAAAMILANQKKLWCTDDSVFLMILATRSYQQLRQVFDEYEKQSGCHIGVAIKEEFSGSFQNGLLAIVQCVESKVGFFVERLHSSMAGLGTRDRTLIRIIVSRSEIDLGDIKKAFEEKYGKSLASVIAGDTSRAYKKVLLALVE